MAIIYSYPQIGELATNDTIAISDASNGNKTKSVTIGQLLEGQATIVQVDDRVVTGASFNTGTGVLTLTRNGGEIPSVTTNLDGRYYLSSNPNSYTSNLGVVQSLTTTGSAGAATLTNGVLNIPQYSGGGGGVTEITTSAPITGGPITTTGSIGISQASTSGDGYISSADWNTFNNKQSTSEKGAASGYAPLDANQKVPSANLPDSLVGAVVYQSTWNAGTDTPTLPTPAAGNNGHYYIVSDPGTYLGITYAIGDWIISNGTDWQKVDNTQDVNSVFGRQGNVVADANDYAAFYDANVQSNWTETNSASDAFILNKPLLSAVAISGNYSDLSNKPTIPTNNNQLTNGAGYTTNLGVVQTLTTTGTSGAATLVGGTLNIPQYSGGGGGVTSIIAGTGISILPGTGVGDVQITNTLAQQTAYDTSSFFSGSAGVDSLAFLFNGNPSDKKILSQYPDTDKLWVVLDLIAYLDTSGGTYTASGDLYVGPDVTIPSESIGIKIPSTFLNSTTNKVIGIRCAMDYEVAENDIKGTDLVLKAFSTPVSISSTGATLKISYTRRLLTNLFD